MFNWLFNFFKRGVYALGVPRSGEWRRVRKEHLLKQPCCQICERKRWLHVHHIVPFTTDPSLELDPTNLVTFCSTCHFIFGHLGKWNSYNPTCREDVKKWQKKFAERP